MSNLQVSDSILDLSHNHPNHDKLFKVRPFLDMMDKILNEAINVGGSWALMKGAAHLKAGWSLNATILVNQMSGT